MGRKKRYELRLTLPISKALVDAVDEIRGKTPRVEFFRKAIEAAAWAGAVRRVETQAKAARKRRPPPS
jgi:hypothetical protein